MELPWMDLLGDLDLQKKRRQRNLLNSEYKEGPASFKNLLLTGDPTNASGGAFGQAKKDFGKYKKMLLGEEEKMSPTAEALSPMAAMSGANPRDMADPSRKDRRGFMKSLMTAGMGGGK